MFFLMQTTCALNGASIFAPESKADLYFEKALAKKFSK